jgi:simple sugar transport system substrate-binding protein
LQPNQRLEPTDPPTKAVQINRAASVNYLRLQNYDNFAPDLAQLIRTAISQKVDGLVIPDWAPESQDPAIKDAMKAGIKVFLMNAGGGDKAKELGAIN